MLLPGCFLLGCTGADDVRGIDGTAGFAPYPDIDHGAMARRIAAPGDSLAAVNVGELGLEPDGSIRLWRPRLADGGKLFVLERYAPDGKLEDRLESPELEDGYHHGDGLRMVFHPDGDLTLVRTMPGGAIEYVRRSATFAETGRVTVPAEGPVALPDFYRVADDGQFTTEPGGMSATPPYTTFVADGAGGFFGTQIFVNSTRDWGGVRLVHLDRSYAMTAATWVLPGNELPVARYGTPIVIDGKVVTPVFRYAFEEVHLLVDHQHRVWALSGGPGSASGALSQAFGRPVELRDSGDMFLLRYSESLQLEAVVSLPAANQQMLGSLAEGPGGAIGVASLSTESRAIEPNKTFNYNVWFASVDRDGNLIGQRELDLDQDDWPYALAACGAGFCIAGETATRWVDTGSQVEIAKGFLVDVGIDGSSVRLSTLHGPRRNVIERMATLGDGSVVFVGTTDGPITHTDPGQRSMSALLGVMAF